jgi:parvulin-like peptidyl-prolyl isomerase
LKTGELSDIVRNEEGLHIVKLTQHTQARQVTFEEARPGIEARLRSAAQQRRLEEWTLQLKTKAKIDIRDEAAPAGRAADKETMEKSN